VNFSQALDRIKWGMPMTRVAWDDPAVYVFRIIPPPDQIDKREADGTTHQWAPTQDDILADDWQDTARVEG
jgi:Protein of unknown function (DUF2829)